MQLKRYRLIPQLMVHRRPAELSNPPATTHDRGEPQSRHLIAGEPRRRRRLQDPQQPHWIPLGVSIAALVLGGRERARDCGEPEKIEGEFAFLPLTFRGGFRILCRYAFWRTSSLPPRRSSEKKSGGRLIKCTAHSSVDRKLFVWTMIDTNMQFGVY